jgi:hypothetical protein
VTAGYLKLFDCLRDSNLDITTTLGNILYLANSFSEYKEMKEIFPLSKVVVFPNNAFIESRLFSLRNTSFPYINDPSNPICVINSKGHYWKKHYLSISIPSRIFVTYDILSGHNLTWYNPKKIFYGLNASQLLDVLHSSDFGGIFSSVEGNCYSSNEYLLTGLPVLSVKSMGGRDMFYEEGFNAVTCEATIEGFSPPSRNSSNSHLTLYRVCFSQYHVSRSC